MRGADDQTFSDWVFHLGSKKGSESKIIKFNNNKNEKLYDFQHLKEYFDDFKQNLVLRVLDGGIQIFHNLNGAEYFPSKYIQDDKIKKESLKSLKIISTFGVTSGQNWTIQRVGINSGYSTVSLNGL